MPIASHIRKQMEESSWIRRMFEEGIELKQRYGERAVFDLSLGNPILEPPSQFKEELARIARSDEIGLHRYMPNAGFTEVRQTIAEQLSAETNLSFSSREIIMTTGAAGALNIFFRSILEAGDEVVIFAPYFPEYLFYIEHYGGKVIVAHCGSDYLPNMNSLADNISERTRAVIVNSPNNPTGAVYKDTLLYEIGQVIKAAEERYKRNIYLVSDEAYRRLNYIEEGLPWMFQYHDRTVVAASFSKDLGLAGERIGYLAISPLDADRHDLIDAAVFALRTLGFVNAPAMMQRVISKLQNHSVDIEKYRQKRDMLHKVMTKIGYECLLPEGGFYMFPKSPIEDDKAFINLLQSKLVLAVPGSGFGLRGHFRVSYCVEDWVLEGCTEGLKMAFQESMSNGAN